MKKDAIWFKGGRALLKKYGKAHFSKLGKLSAKAKKRRAK